MHSLNYRQYSRSYSVWHSRKTSFRQMVVGPVGRALRVQRFNSQKLCSCCKSNCKILWKLSRLIVAICVKFTLYTHASLWPTIFKKWLSKSSISMILWLTYSMFFVLMLLLRASNQYLILVTMCHTIFALTSCALHKFCQRCSFFLLGMLKMAVLVLKCERENHPY
jgi:hypothetical protein